MIKKILLTLFLFFVISESSFGKSYLCMSEKMVMYGWSKDKGWQSFGMDDDVGTAFILKLTEDESKIKSLNRLKPKHFTFQLTKQMVISFCNNASIAANSIQ